MNAKKTSLRVAAALALFAMAGCAKDIAPRGNLPPDDAVSQLTPGEQTRQDVRNLLGTPATTALFDDETWYYISSHTTQYAFYPTVELDRTIYALSFDQRGILKEVRKLNLEDGQQVAINERETPTKGREYSLIEQLIGNLGRFAGAGGQGGSGPGGP
jgi:outer membrane protein assembly factor BamE (lipoprotein component of BamABCDE complex)